MSDIWINSVLSVAQPINPLSAERHLIAKLIEIVGKLSDLTDRRIALAAAFDLLVSAEYYASVGHTGWIYCPTSPPMLFYPYTNTCPRCVLDGHFEYHKANKPRSGSIGATTSRLLATFIQELLRSKGLSIEVFRGSEPVDLIFLDSNTQPTTLLFAEIKASPLLTLPLVMLSQEMISEENEQAIVLSHRKTDHSSLFGSELFILIPGFDNSLSWSGSLYKLGSKKDVLDQNWAYNGLMQLLEDLSFFESYLNFWKQAFESYGIRNGLSASYWFTNGCGQPVPRPLHWPGRQGATGYESVSDSKSSVGMDRTDDIKKGAYQVLKLGAEGKPSQEYRYKTGIVSNIHAVRHFDEYLTSLKDIVWTRTPFAQVKKAGDLAPDSDIFNLFDGIITLTQTVARDQWVQDTFNFEIGDV